MCRPCTRTGRTSPPPEEPTPLTPAASPDEKRSALDNQRLLRQSLEEIRRRLHDWAANDEDIAALLARASRHAENLDEYLSATIELSVYNAVVPPGSSAAQRTFAVPELFEMIMDCLPIPSVLAMTQTCREYKDRIDNSQHMQLTLGLQPASAESRFCLPLATSLAFLPGGGFTCKPPAGNRNTLKTTEAGETELGITAAFSPQGPGQALPRIGATYRRMFVTQPPLIELTPVIRCCRDLREPILRENGITIGDLYDSAAETIEKHRWCPREMAGIHMLENGQNRVFAEFTGKAIVQPSDPVVQKYEEERAEKEKERKRRVWVRRRNSAYRTAKREAHERGEPVPTMPEYLGATPFWNQDPEDPNPLTDMPTACSGVTLSVDAFSFN